MKPAIFVFVALVLGASILMTACAGGNSATSSSQPFATPTLALPTPTEAATAGQIKGPLTVGSATHQESELLGQMIVLMLRANGFAVNDRTGIGTTEGQVREALQKNEIDMHPEYTGNGADLFKEWSAPEWKDLEKGWERLSELDKKAYNVVWLRPGPAPKTAYPSIAISKKLAADNNLKTLDDFAAYVRAGGNVKLMCSRDFVTNAEALPAYESAYGFTLGNDQIVVDNGGTGKFEQAASQGTGGVNAAMASSTDGGIAAFGLVLLEDNRHTQVIFAPAPALRGEIMDRYPEIANILNPVFESLTLEVLQSLNEKISFENQSLVEVARQYLTDKGFLKN